MKAKVKATGKIVDGIPIYYGSEGKGYLDVPVDHDIFDRYDLEEVELLEQPSLPEGLEEAAEKYRRNSCNAALKPNVDGPTPEYGGSIKGAFIAGAEWMKAQDQKTIELAEDHAMLAGMNKMEQQILEGAVEGEVHPDDCEIWCNLIGYGYKFKDGDKVKIIIVKEEQK